MKDIPTTTTGKPRQTAWAAAPLVLAALMGLFRIWVAGYSFGAGDQGWQVPLVRGMAAGAFANDYIFQHVPRVSLFFPMAAALSRIAPVEYVYFALYTAASVAAAIAVYLLASDLLQSRPAAILAVVLLMTGKSVAGAAATWEEMLLPGVAAMPLVVFSWWLALRARALSSGALAGLAFAMDPVTGLWGFLVTLVAVAISDVNGRRLARAGLLAAGAALPVAATAWYVGLSHMARLHAGPQWYDAMGVVNRPQHINFANFPLLAGLLIFVFLAGPRVAPRPTLGPARPRPRIFPAAAAVSAVAFMYIAAAQIGGQAMGLSAPWAASYEPPAMAAPRPMAMAGVLAALALVAAAGVLWRAMQKGMVERLSAAAAAVALAFGHFAVGAGFLAAAVISQEPLGFWRGAALAIAVMSLVAALAFYKALFIFIVATMTAAVLMTLALRERKTPAATATLFVTVVLLGVFPSAWAGRTAAKAFHDPAERTANYWRSVDIGGRWDPALAEAARWARDNSLPGDTFATPPWWDGFRVIAGRPVVGTLADGALIRSNPDLAGPWLERMTALGAAPGSYDYGEAPYDPAAYMTLSADAASELGARFDARYIVRLSADMPALSEAYSGRHVHIYRIPPEPTP